MSAFQAAMGLARGKLLHIWQHSSHYTGISTVRQPDEAIDYYRTAREVAEEVADNVSEELMVIHEHLGDVLMNAGEYAQALESYTAGLGLLEKLPLPDNAAERVAALCRKAGIVHRLKGAYPLSAMAELLVRYVQARVTQEA